MLKHLLFVLCATGSVFAARTFCAEPVTTRLLVANQVDHTLLVLDPIQKHELASVVVGINGHEVIASPDGSYAYVPIYGNAGVGKAGTDGSTIDVVDLRTSKLAGSINLGKPVRPHCAKFGPDGLLYVSAELANALYVVDPKTQRVVGEIPTGQPQTHMFVFSPDGRRIYTANVNAGTVSVLDVAGRKLISTIPVSHTVQRISISTDGRRVFTHDRETPRIAVIDTATNKVDSWIALPDFAYSSASTPDGRWLIANLDAGKIEVVDLATLKIAKSFDIPPSIGEVTINPAGSEAFVSCPHAGVIAVLNIRDWKQEDSIQLTKGVDGLAWATAQ